MEEIFWQFLIYSFFGFLLEVLFARVIKAKKLDRKCLFLLPLCPVYGLGALLITALPAPVQNNVLLLFLFGALAASCAEYFMDWFYEKALGVRFWDYSAMRWNIHGRVCLIFSFAWGFLSLALVNWLHPRVLRLVDRIPAGWTLPIMILFLTDVICTVILLRSTGTTASLRWYDRFRNPAKERP